MYADHRFGVFISLSHIIELLVGKMNFSQFQMDTIT